MTREEEIKQAASGCFDDTERYFCFISGAEWADEHPKDIWHSINDVPIGQHDIICKDNKGKCWHCDWKYIYDSYLNWKEFVETMNVEKWINIREL